jgi:hypothetical protein
MRYSVGASYQCNDAWKVKMGLAYDESPVPQQYRTARLPDNNRLWLSAGLQYASSERLKIDYRKIADTAQSKLEQLQQKIMERNSASGNDGLHTSKTFYDFMAAEHQREMAERQLELERTAHRGQLESKVRSQETKTAHTLHVALPESSAETVTTDIATLIKNLKAIGDDKEAKKAFIHQLPDSVQAAVIAALKQEKDEAARKVAERNAELDKLL